MTGGEATDLPGQVSDGTVARLATLARARPPSCGATVVVAVDGPSGSGKTTLGRQLAEALGAVLVHMDDLYQGWDGLADSPGQLEQHLLAPRARGERAAYRSFDWRANRPDGWHEVPPSRFLVLEGAGSSAEPAAAHLALVIWVQAATTVRRARALDRDGETYRPHWDRWAAQEAALFPRDRTRDRADVVIDTSETPEQVEWHHPGARPS
ncbi:MAG TPA: (d)CMP kinase [Segeticoccus sp.]|uniref:AAA family ATPase n=1 Tax=Segeticoccus sp. TaxID=2706531 RepID=UPI002D7FA0CA|nr:(d)CMP kinase [Segeticoccus sp.]HET8601694.1 (d)CMP kinase [Segeticoccus sp.]